MTKRKHSVDCENRSVEVGLIRSLSFRIFGAVVLSLALLVVGAWMDPTLATAQSSQQAQESDADEPRDLDADLERLEGELGDVVDDGTDASELDQINRILEGEDAMLAGAGATYDPGDRRDPFQSLLISAEFGDLRGPRPDGIPGLLIDEIFITGIFRTPQGWVAQVQSAEQEKSYLVKAGDELFDGDVVRISRLEVVFKQLNRDPTALKPFREVVKVLNPS